MRVWVVLASLTIWLGAQMMGDDITYARLERERVLKRLRKAVPENGARREELKTLFVRAGCRDEGLTDQPEAESEFGDIVCRLPGEGESTILVAAHFDTVPGSDGVADNWSGAALLPTLYQSLRQRSRRHTFLFVAFSSGAGGTSGPQRFVDTLTEDEASTIRAAIVLDTLGLSFTRGCAGKNGEPLLGYLKSVSSSMQLPVETESVKPVLKRMQPFAKRRIPSVAIHSLNKYNRGIAGGPDDAFEAIKQDEYYESYMLTAGYLAFLDGKLN